MPSRTSGPCRSCVYNQQGLQDKVATASDSQTIQLDCPCQKIASINSATWTTGRGDCQDGIIKTE